MFFILFLPDFDKAAALSYVEYVCSDQECPSKSGNTLTLNSNPNLTLILTQTLVIIYPKYNANPHQNPTLILIRFATISRRWKFDAFLSPASW